TASAIYKTLLLKSWYPPGSVSPGTGSKASRQRENIAPWRLILTPGQGATNCHAQFTVKIHPHPDPPPRGGREILDLAKCRAGGKFSLAGATKYFCHERLDTRKDENHPHPSLPRQGGGV
ncbi:MAG: hypothetical protein COX16_08320, partial [Deltaproteobacteria bacterium CG23_combo_of_CG06-09_8_20_14_all_51_20]